MRLLILGGTRFLGKHLAAIASERGHTLTLFNRGKTATQADPGVETILGDRHTDLDRITHAEWDAVIDTCAYHPASVRSAAQALRERVKCYLLVSSVSVFRLDTHLITETSPR